MGRSNTPIIGVGASAGGIEAMKHLLAALPADFEAALVLVLHLAPHRVSQLNEVLATTTPLHVKEISQGDIPESRNVYIIPPNFDVILQSGVFQLEARQSAASAHYPIDRFFESLAEELRDQAIGVILSGTGTDGTIGLQAIKSAGGLTLVQTEGSAEFMEMPLHALQNVSIDFVLNPAEIAEELGRIVRHPLRMTQNRKGFEEDLASDERGLQSLVQLMHERLGFDLNAYKLSTVYRRISRRMLILKQDSLETYLAYIKANLDELQHLLQDILISVTCFFREPKSFAALQEKVFPLIFNRIDGRNTIRLWVPGCATGEEAYSLAMLFKEYQSKNGISGEVLIFASDMSKQAIQIARSGLYKNEDVVLHVSEERRRNFFSKERDDWKVNKDIRDMVVFAIHNVMKDPPFSNLDMISCRNLLIYFTAAAQEKILPMFHFALKPDRFLILGSAEAAAENTDLFETFDGQNKIYRRTPEPSKEYSQAIAAQYFRSQRQKEPGSRAHEPVHSGDVILKHVDQVLLAKYSPSGFLINQNMRVLQFRGETSPLLGPSSGPSSLNLMDLLRPELRLIVRSSIYHVLKTSAGTESAVIPLTVNGEVRHYQLQIIPVGIDEPCDRILAILFVEKTREPKKTSGHAANGWKKYLKLLGTGRKEVSASGELNAEVDFLREQFRSMIEYQDKVNEQLKRSNEEILSSNEELQSTNEELETTKEELYSSVEELRTTNDELSRRNNELRVLNDDLSNLIASIHIPLILVDRNLKIRRYTVDAAKICNLRGEDVGREIVEIDLGFEINDWEGLLKEAVDSSESIDRKILKRDRRQWFSMNLHPFRTRGGVNEGIVITLTSLAEMRSEIQKRTQSFAERMVQSVRIPLVVLDINLQVVMANRAFFEVFSLSTEETLGRAFFELNHSLWDVADLRNILNRAVEKGEVIENFEINKEIVNIGLRTLRLNARQIDADVDGEKEMLLLAIEDITEMQKLHEVKRAKEAAELASKTKNVFLANISHEIRTPLSAIIGFADLLQEDLTDRETANSYVQIVRNNARHLLALVSDVLDISKIEANRLDLTRDEIDLKSEIDIVFEMMSAKASAKGLAMELTVQKNVPKTIRTDSTRFKQILINVIGNSIKFSKNGVIKLDVDVNAEQKIQLTVTDAGAGIAKSMQQEIFDRFSQGNPVSFNGEGGTGIGLTLSRELARLLGGDLVLLWSEAGLGSSFQITVDPGPLGRNRNWQVSTSHSGSTVWDLSEIGALLHGVRVLIAEDAKDVRMLYSHYLAQAGAKITMVHNGQEAVEIALKESFDVIVMDLRMPLMDGLQATLYLRERNFTSPILVLTANAIREEREVCISAGCDEFLTKPINGLVLCRAVAKWHRIYRAKVRDRDGESKDEERPLKVLRPPLT